MYQQIVAYPFNGILLSNKKEWTIYTHDNMEEFQNNFTSDFLCFIWPKQN